MSSTMLENNNNNNNNNNNSNWTSSSSSSSSLSEEQILFQECAQLMEDFATDGNVSNGLVSTVFNVTRVELVPEITTTWLRNDPLYYRIYCIGLNTVFATVIPFVLLLYFNVKTVLALSTMGKQVRNSSTTNSSSRKQSP